jgi:hypothetical protein
MMEAEEDEEARETGTDLGRGLVGRMDLTVADMRRRSNSRTVASSDCHLRRAAKASGGEAIQIEGRDYA